jgi:hypothetical protein
MKIYRKKNVKPLHTISLWAIPTLTYIVMKLSGWIRSDREFIWWLLITTSILVWGLINWKIKK